MTSHQEKQNVDKIKAFIIDGWGVLMLALAILVLVCLYLIGILQ